MTKKPNYFGVDETTLPQIVISETVKEILSIAERELGKPKKDLIVLDVGSGFGRYSIELGRFVKKVVGVEPFKPAFERSVALNRRSNVKFIYDMIENYNTKEKFDLAISLTTVEHMPKAAKSIGNVFKLLKKNGLLYLTAPNKLWPIEAHYNLLFLSYLPLPFANLYMRIMKKGKSYKESSYSRTYFGMKKLLDKFNWNYSFVLPESAQAAYLGCGQTSPYKKFVRSFGIWLIGKFPFFWVISKGFIIVAKKK